MHSTRTSRRRASLIGAGAAAAALGLASTAFACTIYKGKITVSDTTANGTTTASADGYPGPTGTANHTFCSNPAVPPSTVQLGQPVDLDGDFTVTAGETTNCPTTQYKADVKDYTIHWATPKPMGPVEAAQRLEAYIPGHCNETDNTLTQLGAAVDVLSSGAFDGGAKTRSVPSGVLPGPAAICFRDATTPSDSNVLPEVRLLVL